MIVPALQLLFPSDITGDERDLLTAALQDHFPAAVHEVSDREWRVFFRTEAERDAALGAPIFGRASAARLDVPDENWARRSQEALRAITVGRLIVAPPWDLPETGAGRPGTRDTGPATGNRGPAAGNLRPGTLDPGPRTRDPGPGTLVVIEPSTGFGTGHHATTRLCLRGLQHLSLYRKTVLDVGTGSGVLAIAAAVLGAAHVIAIDNDPDAIQATRANIELNGVAIDLRLAGLTSADLPHADVVVANLTGAALRRHAATLVALARHTLIVSGLLSEEADGVGGAFATTSSVIAREDEDGWVAFTLTIP